MKIKYTILADFNTGDLIPSIRETENVINDITKSCGFTEKINCKSSNVPMLSIESERELKPEEEIKIKNMFIETYNEKIPNLTLQNVRLIRI